MVTGSMTGQIWDMGTKQASLRKTLRENIAKSREAFSPKTRVFVGSK